MYGCPYCHLSSACTHTCPQKYRDKSSSCAGGWQRRQKGWHYQFQLILPNTHWKYRCFWHKQLGYIVSKFYARPRYLLQGRRNILILDISKACAGYKTAIPCKFSCFSGQLFRRVRLKLRWFSSYLLLKHTFLLSRARSDYIVSPSETKVTISSEQQQAHNNPKEHPKELVISPFLQILLNKFWKHLWQYK